MDMCRHSATGRGKLRRLRLTVFHRVLVLEDLREEFCLFRETGDSHAASSPCGFYVGRSHWFYDSVFYTYRFCYCFSVFPFDSFSRYLFMVS
jgi:hypothetical protein